MTGIQPVRDVLLFRQPRKLDDSDFTCRAVQGVCYLRSVFFASDIIVGDDDDKPPEWELFDLDNDAGEMVSVYDDPAYSTVTGELKLELKRLRQELEDETTPWPEDG